ncbi:MAG: hypothetical protein H6829_07145 [Planctomycetes bacterium]|nr:hypothetical protein [Planctomycetota bacterium]MCB9912999.1 hypothetical protein [Planctomycetota bacterium]HRV82854.1 hypothetical protein [Planctomycetota bacterium]
MTRYLPTVVAALLGLAFVAFGLMFLLDMVPPQEPPPEGSPTALFMGAMFPTHYLHFVKVLEVLGGLLVAIPRTRNFGLLILVPIVVNILAFHIFIAKGQGLLEPPLLIIVALVAYLLWTERRAIAGLAR